MFQMPREAFGGGGGPAGGDHEESDSSNEEELQHLSMDQGEAARRALEAQVEAWKEEEEMHAAMLQKVMPPPELPLEVVLNNVSLEIQTAPKEGGIPFAGLVSGLRKRRKDGASPKEKKRVVLKDINLTVRPGELLAIMGPTGCGKSTLLNTIAGRVGGKLTGDVLFNGRPRSKALRRHIAYVLQDDIMFPMLTVEQTLEISAKLKLPESMSDKEKVERVHQLIELLGLSKCKSTIIGDARVRGVSGGERKRTNIGNEIVTGPSMLLLDEPTSGLDSSTAESILSLLKQYALGGRTVITTIHQPSSRIFEMFDKLLLMCDGHIVYYGPGKDAIDYFASLGYNCPPNYNPADFLLGLLSITASKAKKGVNAREHLIKAYEKQKPFEDTQDVESGNMKARVKSSSRPDSLASFSKDGEGSDVSLRKYPTSWWKQFCVLLYRSFLLQKPKMFDKIPFIQVIFTALIVGLLWLRVDKTEERIQDRLAVTFFIAIFAGGFVPLLAAVFSIPMDRTVVTKERASKSYQISAYFFAKNLSELPLQFVYPTIFVCITYWMVGLNSDPGRFFTYYGFILLSNFTSSSLGLLAGALFLDISFATLAASVLTLSMMLVGGFFLQMRFLGWWIRWSQYLSFLRYLYSALLTNELDGLKFKQQKHVISPYDPYDPIRGSDVLKVLGISEDPFDLWSYALVILGFGLLFRLLAFLSVRFMHRPPNK